MSKITKLLGIGKKKKPAPLPPLPKREDPELEAARKKQKLAEKVRLGRGASIQTTGSGLEDEDDKIKRPGARSAKLLGG